MVPNMLEGIFGSKSSNIAATYMIFCGKQRGLAPLLATKYHVCSCDITGFGAKEPEFFFQELGHIH